MNTPESRPTRRKVTVPDLARMKTEGRRIAMITAYDATFARLVDDAGVDMILVGDSVGMVVQGEANTIPVELDDTISLGVGHLVGKDRGAGQFLARSFENIGQAVAEEDVVAKHQAGRTASDEVGADRECLGEALGLGLHRIA